MFAKREADSSGCTNIETRFTSFTRASWQTISIDAMSVAIFQSGCSLFGFRCDLTIAIGSTGNDYRLSRLVWSTCSTSWSRACCRLLRRPRFFFPVESSVARSQESSWISTSIGSEASECGADPAPLEELLPAPAAARAQEEREDLTRWSTLPSAPYVSPGTAVAVLSAESALASPEAALTAAHCDNILNL